MLSGRADLAAELADQTIARALSSPDTVAFQFDLRYFALLALVLPGRIAEARGTVPELSADPGPLAVVTRDLHDARVALDEGRVGTAASLFVSCRPSFPGHGGGWTSILEAALAQARGMTGDVEGAREACARAEQFRHPGVLIVEPDLMLARAWVAAAEGAVSTARARARDAADLAGTHGQYAVEVVARHAAVCFGDPDHAVRLGELAGMVSGPRAPSAAAPIACASRCAPSRATSTAPATAWGGRPHRAGRSPHPGHCAVCRRDREHLIGDRSVPDRAGEFPR